MSVEATLSVLKPVLKALLKEWREFKGLKNGERRELEQLEEDLRLLQAFLKDSAMMFEKSHHFKEREKQIRELVYEVEDTIEMCLTKKAVAKTKIVSRYLEKLSTSMAKQVKSLREEKVRKILDLIDKDIGKIDIPISSLDLSSHTEVKVESIEENESVTCIEHHSTGKKPSVSTTQDHVVDFEEEEAIIRYLMEPKYKLDVISITGMPGLGKTTLARKIFNDAGICQKFPLRIWIHVSQTFNSRDTFLKILEKVFPRHIPNMSDQELTTKVRECLEDEDFFLVIDDLWTVKDWEVIQKILPEENKMGRVVVTSRLKEVAVQVNIYRNPHELGFLKEDKSWELLKLKVLGDRQNIPPELDPIGKAIANKCDGLPLAIVVIGGVLKSQFTKTRALLGLQEKWSSVLENLNEILKQDKDNSISNVVELSYNTLPANTRVCFLYSGLFPENHEIPVTMLTQLWIEEGFILPKGKSIEETAEEVLDDLINKNLLMVMKKNLDQVKTCRVHDMIREFCKAKAMEENLFSVMRESKEGVIEPPVSEVERSHRLCLHSGLSQFLSAVPNGPCVRSFLCFLEEPCDLDPLHISTIPDSFKKLRILNCSSIKFRQFPKVQKMILLKHITLYIENLDALPAQIYQLSNLRTLIVGTNSRHISVKSKIWKMRQLRRLKTKAAFDLDDKKWTGKASENLHTITRLSPDSCKESLSERAPNLKKLGIRGKVANLFSTFSLKNFLLLKKLKLENELLLHESAYTPAFTQLNWNCFPPNLESLSLSNTYLTWEDHVPILADIRALKVLKLKDNAFTGVTWDAVGHGFENLQSLHIENTGLIVWNASDNHFPSLRCLVLKKCALLQEIPVAIAKNLEKLEIEHVLKSAADSARRIEGIKKEAEREQNQISACGVPFKLTIGPGCDQ